MTASTGQRAVPTADDIRSWPVTVDVPTGLSAWGIKRDLAYRIAREGGSPVPVLTLGRSKRITRASVMAALGITEVAAAAPGNALASGASAQFGASASDGRSEASASRVAA